MRIAVHPMDSAGHLNPMLALCTKMMERGHFIRFFLNSDKNEKNLERLPFKGNFDVVRVYEDGGEQVSKENMMNSLLPHQDQTESDQKVSDILVGMLVQSSKQIPAVLEKVKEFKPDLIVYDPFMLDAMVVAYLLNIPCASTITYPSFNHFIIFTGKGTEFEKRQVLEDYKQSTTMLKLRNQMLEDYDIDLFENFIPSTFYLRSGLQICTGTKEFELSMPSAVQEIYGGMDAECKYVGPMLLSEEQGRVSSIPHGSKCERQWIDEPFPHDELEKYKRKGKKIVYASFGTVATGFFWDYSGPTSNMMGAKTSGKEFCRTMWKRVFEAFGGNDKYVVVMATVTEDPDALRGFDIPANFIVRRKCPQLDVLKVADVFITHGGANSMMESISAHVPMLVLPYVVDQFDNAEIVSRQGIGMHHSDPINAGTSHFLAMDVETLVMLRDRFAANCARLHKSLQDAGGAEKASQCIEEYVSNFKGHQIKKGMSTRYTGHYINHILSSFGSGRFMMEESGSSFDNVLPDEQQV